MTQVLENPASFWPVFTVRWFSDYEQNRPDAFRPRVVSALCAPSRRIVLATLSYEGR